MASLVIPREREKKKLTTGEMIKRLSDIYGTEELIYQTTGVAEDTGEAAG